MAAASLNEIDALKAGHLVTSGKNIKSLSGMVIGIDAANLRQGGGITHLAELLKVAKPEEHGITKVIVWSNASTLASLEDRPWLVKLNPPDLEEGLIKRMRWQKFKLSRAAHAVSCDLLFVPGGSYMGNFKPVVTMSQNMLPFEWQELSRYGLSLTTLKLLLLRLTQSFSFKHAYGVIFLTHYAKDGVLKITGALQGQTPIIPHGLSARFQLRPKPQRAITDYSIDNPYRLIYVSIIDQYKHQWQVVEAVAALRLAGLPVTLDLVGPAYPPALSRLVTSIKQWDPQRSWVMYHGEIPYKELHVKYAQADLGIFASSCENMPIILMETMAAGLPIVCSKRGPMPEMLGEAGVYFDPEQPLGITQMLRELIASPQLRAELAQASYERSRQFTWQRCAEDTFAFLARAAFQYHGGATMRGNRGFSGGVLNHLNTVRAPQITAMTCQGMAVPGLNEIEAHKVGHLVTSGKNIKSLSGLVIGIDGTNLRQGGGITHLVELLRTAKPESHGIAKVFVWSNIDTLTAIEDRSWLVKLSPPTLNQGLLKRIFWQKIKLSQAAYAENCDLLFVPGGSYAGNFKPFVTMSRNMLPFEEQESGRYGWTLTRLKFLLLRLSQSRSFKHADGLIFLTHYAKEGVLKIIDTVEGSMTIIPHGLSTRFHNTPKIQRFITEYTFANPYRLIYVSIIDHYKHQWHVIEAVAALRAAGLPVELDLVGPAYPPALCRLEASIKQWDPERRWVIYHGEIPYNELHLKYAQADLGIFASSCENMPNILLETMSAGLPIACSNRGPMPEVLGDAGIYFDPEQPLEIAQALRELIDSPDLRAKLIQAALVRTQAFSWERCADETFNFLVQIAKQNIG